jgi:hypothetical protein
MNAIAEKAAYYARLAQYASDGFSQVYLGAKDVAPTADNNGNPLIVGALYYNTVDDLIYTWDGTIWSAILVGTNTNQTITGVKTFTQPIVGSITGNASGNAGTATTLQTARTIGISGSVTGTATSFNGGANITIPATITTGATITSPNLAGTATGALTSKVVQGITDATSATAGFIGETFSASTSATSIADDDIETGATLNLSAGVWEVFGQAIFNFSGVTTTSVQPIVASISPSTGAINYGNCNQVLIPVISTGLSLSPAYSLVPLLYRLQTVVNFPVYITVKSPTRNVGTMTFETSITAIRVR